MMRLIRRFAVLVASLPLIAHGNIVIVNNDSAGEGFNDNTPVSTVGGNTGITLGEQRLNVFQRAADILNNTFDISAVVRVGSSFDPLECYPYSAVLGQAGPAALEFDSNTRNVTPHALYNQQVGYDADNSEVEITAQFNSSIDGNDNCLYNTNWYYGYDAPSGNDNSLLSVVLHEIIHGMGFLSYLQPNGSSGVGWNSLGGFIEGFDPYTRLLKDASTGQMLTDQTAGTRSNVMESGTDLVWNGAATNAEASNYNAGINAGHVQMYAPSAYDSGSSVSHFDTAMNPNELMEPQYTEFMDSPGLAEQLLVDIGWTQSSTSTANTAPVLAAIGDRSLPEDGSLSFPLSATDADGDSVSFSLDAHSAALGVTLSGSTLSINPNSQFNGSGTITISASDGVDSDSETFTVTVTAVNDAPVLASISDQSVNEESSTSLSLSATDVDGDTLTYQIDSAPAAFGVSISGATLSINPVNDFTGSGTVTVSVSDGSLSDSQTFTVTVNNVNDAPVISAIGNLQFDWDDTRSLTLTATDVDGDSLTFSASSSDTSAIATSVSGSTLTLTPATSTTASATITVTVTDGSLSASTPFTAELTEPTSTTSSTQLGVSLDSTAFLDGQTYEAGLNPVSIVPTGGAGNYTVTVFYDGVDRSELLSGSAMLLPETGAFAGTYSVDISDGDGTTLSVYIDRPLRLTPSVDPLMQNTSSASLMIQGAPSGTSIGLVGSTGISFTDSDGNSVTSTTAPDAADTYNATTISLTVADVLNGSVTTSATNIPDSTTSLNIVEARTVTLTVVDTNGRPVSSADVTFEDERFSEWDLDMEYETDENGQVELTLPAIDLEAQIDGEEYRSSDLEIPAAAATVEIALEPASIAYRLSGLITAQGFTFSSESPEVTIQLTDGSEVTAELLSLSNTRIEYTWESTLGSALPETLTVSHSAIPPVRIGLNPVASEELVDIALISETDDDSATGAGQIGYGLVMAFGLLALWPRRRSEASHKTNPKAA